MPRGDRMGPLGKGPKTGRGFGLCSDSSEPEHMNNFERRGMGRGQGSIGNRCRGCGEKSFGRLNRRKEIEPTHEDLYEMLEEIRDRLDKLEK